MRSFAALVASFSLLLAACGGAEDARPPGTTPAATGGVTMAAPGWAAPLLRGAGPEGALVMASSDFAIGSNRIAFLLVRADGSLVESPVADVYFRPRPGGATRKIAARLTPIGALPDRGADEVTGVYVARLTFPVEGKHWVVVQPRGVRFQGFQILDVKRRPTAVAVGERAPSSRNPTLDTAAASSITTARPPDTALLRHSVAESLQKNVPFVVAFATPAFCQSRTCGPTVEVVDAVRRRLAGSGVRFIHVEIYESNLPGNGVNRWVKEWRLPTEPWVFVVDRAGIVRDRFEGAISVAELEASVRNHLLR